MAIVRYTDESGRECKLRLPPRNLSEITAMYHPCECQCTECAALEGDMEEIRLQEEDVVRFSTGREASGRELVKCSAGRTLTALARQHAARKKISFSEALRVVSKICPGEMRDYLQYQLPEGNLLPRGVGRATEISFRASEGWSEAGVADWLEEQGLSGGTLKSTANGWTWVPEAYVDAYPR